MELRIGSKIVRAKPLSKYEFRQTYLNQVKHEDQDKEGYVVEYTDGYKGWNEKSEFEKVAVPFEPADYSFFGVSKTPQLDGGGAEYYIQTKIIMVFPQNHLDYKKQMGFKIAEGEDDSEGYQILYPSQHKSWCPKDKLDEYYRNLSDEEHDLYMLYDAIMISGDDDEDDSNTFLISK